MPYKDVSFDVTIDKGCLDAVFPENKQENQDKINILFKDIIRITKKRYIFVSLL